jgi:hypothetical protein
MEAMAMKDTKYDPVDQLKTMLGQLHEDSTRLPDHQMVDYLDEQNIPMSNTFRDIYTALPPSVQTYVDDELRGFAKRPEYSPETLRQMLLTLNIGSPNNEANPRLSPEDQESIAGDWRAVALKLRESYGLPPGGEEFACWRRR